ncbi:MULTISPECIES: hypothetical protein [Chryseobacterium]|uniref:Uncharacterized protein n=1 Tax=Chryseobacterium geocarposphaerae TaxID=1416776 RepID=A0ABU1LHN1_9FLAO|nr:MULTISPECIES: hypothetical protein [Chryseobacterium]MDR6406226.1 hypothetical protein [Chryseobacterium geocarposphaerae]MDR6699754.1 hypothetical protein [Chryseobacterium ginsenosidimutans]
MRNIVFGFLVVFCAFLSCRNGDDEDLQKIDQIINIYMKNDAGRDLFHKKKDTTYFTYSMNDVNGDKDIAPVSSSLKATSDSTLFIEYIAGAKRVGLDTLDPNNKTYHSVITVSLLKHLNNTVIDTISEELEIQYRWTPSVFEVSKVYYNDTLRFTKTPGSSNVVTIVK